MATQYDYLGFGHNNSLKKIIQLEVWNGTELLPQLALQLAWFKLGKLNCLANKTLPFNLTSLLITTNLSEDVTWARRSNTNCHTKECS